MNFLQFDIDPDRVVLDGAILFRPSRISASQWMEFWEHARDVSEFGSSMSDELRADLDASRGEVASLEYEVEDLKHEVAALEDTVRNLRLELAERDYRIESLEKGIRQLEGLVPKC